MLLDSRSWILGPRHSHLLAFFSFDAASSMVVMEIYVHVKTLSGVKVLAHESIHQQTLNT